VVNYYDPKLNLLWIEGDHTTALLPVAPKFLPFFNAQRVRVSGTIIPAEGLDASKIKIDVVEVNVRPTPIRSRFENLAGRDGRIVQFEGLVDRQFEPDANHLALDVVSEGQHIHFHVWHESGTTVPELKDFIIRGSGAYAARYDSAHRVIGRDLWVSSPADLVKSSALSSDPRFRYPATPINGLAQVVARTLVHLVGTVKSYEPGRRLVMADETGEVELATEQTQSVQVGDTVEAIGYAWQEGPRSTLLDPLFRPRTPTATGEAPSETPAAQRVEEVLNLGLQEAEKKHRVTLRGVVTFTHPEWGIFYLNDATGGLMVSLGNMQMVLPPPGTALTITGTTAGGIVSPSVVADHLTVHGVEPLPQPRPTTFPQAATGADDGQWVEMRALLLNARVSDGWVSLRLNAQEKEISVSIPTSEAPHLPIGTDLRVRGVCASWISTATQRFGGFFLFTPSLAQLITLDPTESATLETIELVRRLTPDEANQGRLVRLSGVVTFSHPEQRLFFLHDGTGSVTVQLSDDHMALPAAGADITVMGRTLAGVFSTTVQPTQITVRGTRHLPEPTLITLDQAMTGKQDAQWVEMYGNLRQIAPTSGWVRLFLTLPTGDVTVNLQSAEAPKLTIGSFLRVRGVCVDFPSTKNQVGGVFLYTSSAADIHVVGAAPADPFSLPEVLISNLHQYLALPGQQVLIRGVVLQHVPGRYLFVENASGVVRALSRDSNPLVPGDRVDVVGLPGREGNQYLMRDAVYRRTGSGPAPKPLNPADGLKLDSSVNGRLVTFTGTLLDVKARNENIHLFVQSGLAVHEVVFEGSLPPPTLAKWEPGSLIQVLGLYQLGYNEYNQPNQFTVLLRTPEDLAVLKRPGWWTLRKALFGLGVIGGLLVLGLSWAASLRRRVQQQTEVIRAQLAKEANLEARHREIIENASDFIFTTDLTGKFTSFNRAGERITGYARGDALQMNIRDLIAPEDAVSGAALLSLALAPEQSETARFETRFRTRDNRRVWMETSARLILEDGQAVCLLGVARDISERKEIEDELKRAHAAAEANTRAKSAFLANMSHEIRTPMSGVIGMTNLLLDTSLRPEQREFAEAIHGSAEALLTILNDILDFSKIEAGKLQFESIDFEITVPIDDSLSLLAARAADKKIELASDIAVDLPRHVCGDPGRLRQVLINLIGNAVKFTERGEVVVTVSRESDTPTEVVVRFEVSDTGIGMSEEAKEQLFRPFMQADSSTTRRFGGTGLGLAICKQMVELMGGQIGVRSELGRGSVFWFTARLSKPAKSVSLNALPEIAALKGVRVLGVDDNATNRKILSHTLLGWQIRCDLVASGAEALPLLAAAIHAGDPYRVVMLDYAMPEMDGVTLARTIRKHRAYDGMPVLLLTSLDQQFSREELAEIGISRVLIKPIRQSDLLRAILRLLGDSSGWESLPPQTQVVRAPETPVEATDLRIVVAEDNLVNQRIIQMQLKKLGFTADLVASGVELLKAFEHKTYDLVLMDCQMPEMDGYEAARQLRASGRFPDLRIIAMTANTMQGDREKCLAAGMDDYLSKPARPEVLRETLSRWAARIEKPV